MVLGELHVPTSILLRRKSSIPKSVRLNPVAFLVFRDFSNKYCFAVNAISDIKNKSGHSPAVVRYILSAVIGSSAARGSTADQITQALSAQNSTDGPTERLQLVNIALNEWAILSTAGLKDVPLDKVETKRICRLQMTTFISDEIGPVKSQFYWLIRHRMDTICNHISKTNPKCMETWIKQFSKGRFSEVVPKQCNKMIVIAAALNFKAKWNMPLEAMTSPYGTFETSPTDKIKVPMYKVTTKVVYYKDANCGFHLVGILFKDRRFALVFLIPLVPHQYKEVEERFTEGLDYSLFRNHTQFVKMHVVIPLFCLQTNVDLYKALSFLGMMDPFDSDRADFSGISDAENLHLEGGNETSFLQVSQHGVIFQSVAALNLGSNKRPFKHPEIVEKPELHWQEPKEAEGSAEDSLFVVNQPFGVILIDRETEAVLFNGRVKVPQTSSNSSD